jgi:hypothetical protein
MFGLLWGESAVRGSDLGRRREERRGRGGASRRSSRPQLEGLEVRITPSTVTWTGLGSDTNWTTANNWSSDTPPSPGDDLVFPLLSSASPYPSVNNFAAGTTFNSITIGAAGYSLSGNAVVVSSDIVTTYTSGKSSDSMGTTLGSGTISLAAGGRLDLSGELAGSAGLSLFGGGTLDLLGANSYTGTTMITSSNLLVDSTIGTVQDNGGVLGGNGTVGDVTSVGGTISPGHNPSPGVLTTSSLTLDSNSTFAAVLDGTSPGNGTTGYDQVVASEAVQLGGAALNASIGSGFTPAVGDQLTIIQNNSGSPVSGTFAGLAEGAAVNVSGTLFQITYQGGPNHDNVVLTVMSVSTTTTTVTSSSQIAVNGQPVTFTATVTPTSSGLGTPTGTVVFLAGSTPIGEGTLNSSRQATFTTSSLGFGAYSITAIYLGDATFQGSKSSAIIQYVTSAGTQPTLTVVPVRNRHGAIVKVDLVAQVGVTSPGTGTPLGNATFYVNGRASIRTVPVNNGTAVLTLPVQRAVNRFVFVRYLGYFTMFQPSTSDSLIISRRILRAAQSVTESSSRKPLLANAHLIADVKDVTLRGHRHHS